jgi:hypothetical protein
MLVCESSCYCLLFTTWSEFINACLDDWSIKNLTLYSLAIK